MINKEDKYKYKYMINKEDKYKQKHMKISVKVFCLLSSVLINDRS